MELSQFDLMKNPPDINTTKMIMNKGNIYDLCKIGRNKSYYVAIVALGYLIKFVIHNHRDHRPKSQQKFQ